MNTNKQYIPRAYTLHDINTNITTTYNIDNTQTYTHDSHIANTYLIIITEQNVNHTTQHNQYIKHIKIITLHIHTKHITTKQLHTTYTPTSQCLTHIHTQYLPRT